MFLHLRCSNKLLRRLLSLRDPVRRAERNSSEKKPTYPKRIFSGIQPTGKVHLGNYFGAIHEWVTFQDSGEDVIWSIVDMHAFTMPQNPEELLQNTFQLTATLIACGIDPERSILFQQSTVPMHAELCWILSCLTTMPRLRHLPQFKEKSEKLKDIPLGLFIYPVLQSADILLYKATHVPVGQDQVQHLQLAQHLAHIFNTKYGETFPLPHSIINGMSGRIKSLRDPIKKMSKSSDDPKSTIDITDTPDVILSRIKKSLTDCTSKVTYDPQNRPGVSNLVTLHSLTSGKLPEDVCEEAQNENLDTGMYKLVVAEAIIQHLRPIRQRYMELIQDPAYLEKVLKSGTERAMEIASQHWLDIRQKIGFGNGGYDAKFKTTKLKAEG